MPLDRIVLETDCPYLSPATHLRQRNDSSKIISVISTLAKLKNVSEEKIVEITNENAKRVYSKLTI